MAGNGDDTAAGESTDAAAAGEPAHAGTRYFLAADRGRPTNNRLPCNQQKVVTETLKGLPIQTVVVGDNDPYGCDYYPTIILYDGGKEISQKPACIPPNNSA